MPLMIRRMLLIIFFRADYFQLPLYAFDAAAARATMPPIISPRLPLMPMPRFRCQLLMLSFSPD